MQQNSSVKFDIYIAWFILVLFFLYQYMLRSAPGVLIEEVRHTFNIDADHFALIGAMYYYGYSFAQVPLGLIIDRKGIRVTALWSIALCIFGTFLFTVTNNSVVAYMSRLIVGLGAASAFMSSIKLANDYFPVKLRGVAIGATLTFGSLGALITGKPLNYLVGVFSSWQVTFILFACLGLVLLFLAYLYIPKNNKIDKTTPNFSMADFIKVLTNKQTLLYAIIAIGLFVPLSVMADLWGTAFLMKKFNLTREIAGPVLMNIYIGMAFGSIIIPCLTHKYGTNKLIKISSIILLILFFLLVYLENLSLGELRILLIVIGFFCGAEMLCFSAALVYTEPKFSGLTIGVVNSLNMLSGAIMQQIIGFYLDYGWNGKLDSQGLRIYSVNEFIAAFSILVIIIAICALIAFFTLKDEKR